MQVKINYKVRKIILFLIASISLIQFGFSQNEVPEIQKFLKEALPEGNMTFQIMESKKIKKETQVKLLLDEHENIINPPSDIDEVESSLVVDFIAAELIDVSIKYIDSSLTIVPINNKNIPSISIDFNNNVVSLINQKLNIFKEVSIKNSENGFDSSWNGYRWYNKPTNHDTKKNAVFTIGKLKKKGEIYIEIQWSEDEKIKRFRLLSQ